MAAAINAADASRYAAAYEQDATIIIFGGATVRGREAIEAYERDLLAQFPGTRFALIEIWQAGNQVAVHYGVNSPPHGTMPATGHEGLLFYDIGQHGLIAEEHRYLDGLTPAIQAGALPHLQARGIPSLPERATIVAADADGRSEAVARGMTEAFNEGNEQAVLARFATHGRIDELALPTPFLDAVGVRAWFTMWRRAVPNLAIEVRRRFIVGSYALWEEALRGDLADSLGGIVRPVGIVLHRGIVAQVRANAIDTLRAFMNRQELRHTAAPPQERQVRE